MCIIRAWTFGEINKIECLTDILRARNMWLEQFDGFLIIVTNTLPRKTYIRMWTVLCTVSIALKYQ